MAFTDHQSSYKWTAVDMALPKRLSHPGRWQMKGIQDDRCWTEDPVCFSGLLKDASDEAATDSDAFMWLAHGDFP